MNSVQSKLRQFEGSLMRLLLLRLSMWSLAMWSLAIGLALLVIRFLGEPTGILRIIAVAGLLPLAVACSIMARRRLPDRASLAAMLDQHNGAGGLLMATVEGRGGDWQPQLASTPAVRFENWNPLKALVGSVCFLLFAALVPISLLVPPLEASPDLSQQVDALAEDVVLLDETKLLEPEVIEALEQALVQMRESGGEKVGSSWEALDRLEARLASEGSQAQETLEKMQQELNQLQALAEKLGQSEHADKNAAVSELSELFRDTQAKAGQAGALSKEMMDQLSNPSPEQLAKLKEGMERSQELTQKLAGKLGQLKTMPKNGQKSSGQAAKDADKNLSDFLASNSTKCKGLVTCIGGTPSGKPGEDGNAAALTWQDPSNAEDVVFEQMALPPAALSRDDEGELVGLDSVAPDLSEGHSDFGALSGSDSGNGAAHRQTVLPRHRGAVSRFFGRE